MRSITLCPACQTQFFVTEEQLNKHHGQVRCGHCLHVFDAREQIIDSDSESEGNVAVIEETTVNELSSSNDLLANAQATVFENIESLPTEVAVDTALTATVTLEDITVNEPSASDDVLDLDNVQTPSAEELAPSPTENVDATAPKVTAEEIAVNEPSVSADLLDLDNTQSSVVDDHESSPPATADAITPTDTADYSTADLNTSNNDKGNSVDAAFIGDDQPYNADDLADKSEFSPNYTAKKPRTWLWAISALVLLLFAVGQSIYFLRNEIAIYYPNAKPYLVQACKQIACSIDLPKKIEFIVIDDSDIQEDANYVGLVHLSSTIINQAAFNQAYPNIELTLTDADDKPILRRVFKPAEYLPSHANITNGFGPGEELKIKLAMTTQGVTVAGYRVFVTY